MKVIVCKVSKNRYQHFAIQVYPISFIPAKFQTTSIRILIYCCRVSRVSFIGTDEERRLDSNVGCLVLNWIMIYLNGILFFVLVFFNQGAGSAEFEYIQNTVQENEASLDCRSRGKYLAVVDSQEKFDQVYNILTNGGREMPSTAVYIGLTYNTAGQQYEWVDGTPVNWVNWFVNEPYNVDTRHCVRLDLDSNLRFRTTDCSYQHHYLCSSTGTAVTVEPSTNKKSSNDVMIVGLSVGFGVSAAVIAVCCLMCYCCCSSRDEPKRPLLLHHNCPPKPRAVVGSLRRKDPPGPSVYYSKYSSSRNSNNTSWTGSSRMDDVDDDLDSVVINPSDRRMSVYSGSTGDYQRERSSASPRNPNEILHYI
ncbi:uncharacterized protein LOC125663596 [Ostrea edulis]|uniref:uncharacterized protein LOC125663596 n=1 Tax=Ostrea edulis TaxID=37623 RepID=UPI0024AF7E2F|nr:uncharacterized protein LOC125663596 [Ostrea edulis]